MNNQKKLEPTSEPLEVVENQTELTREEVRARLLAAGMLVTEFEIPENPTPLTVEERLRIGTLAPGSKPSLELINEDRGAW